MRTTTVVGVDAGADAPAWPGAPERPELAARYASMAEPFLASARRAPDRTAIVFGAVELTYAQVNAAVNRTAHVLTARGVRAGDRVAYLLPNCPELIELYYAIQKIGAVAVPLNIRSIAREVAYLVNASGAAALVFAGHCADRLDEVVGDMPGLTSLLCVDSPFDPAGPEGAAGLSAPPDPRPWSVSLSALQRGAPDDEPELVRDAQAVSRIQYTGGSTGTPKGVERSHRADLVEIEGTYLSNGLRDDERKVVLIQCPLEHHGGHDWFAMAIALGATLVICATFDAPAILDQIERHRVSYMILLPPATLARLMRDPATATHDLSSVRLVQSAAGGTTPEMIRAVHRHFPNAVMNYGWGQTESGLGTSLVLTLEMAERGLPRAASIGRPMPFIEMQVLGEDDLPVPDGVVGEGAVRSEAVMTRYHGQDEATRAAFTADGWLRTGDMMVRDADGYLYLKARRRELIKSGGENVFVGEVEAVVRAHPAVADCLIYAVADDCLGEAVAAAVELRPGASLTLEELQAFCRDTLASYKKPRDLQVLATLDRDFSGKVDRARLIRTCAVLRAAQESRQARPDLTGAYEQVCADPDVFRIPLPHAGGLEAATTCYLVRGRTRSLLVDTGSNTTAGLGLLARVLDALGVRRCDTDILVTHEHADHTGLAWRIRDDPAEVYVGAAGAAYLRRACAAATAEQAVARWAAEGFAPDDVVQLERMRLRSMPTALLGEPLVEVVDGDVLRVDGYELRVLATPGHTPGSVCLYQPDRQILLTGDHVLPHVTPPLCWLPGEQGTAAGHLAGLRRVAELPVRLWLPAHGPLGGDCAARAHELVEHHEARLRTLADLVARTDGLAAADLVGELGWRNPAVATWRTAPPSLRWLTAGQTVAYLDLLVERGTLRRSTTRDGRHRYHGTPHTLTKD